MATDQGLETSLHQANYCTVLLQLLFQQATESKGHRGPQPDFLIIFSNVNVELYSRKKNQRR